MFLESKPPAKDDKGMNLTKDRKAVPTISGGASDEPAGLGQKNSSRLSKGAPSSEEARSKEMAKDMTKETTKERRPIVGLVPTTSGTARSEPIFATRPGLAQRHATGPSMAVPSRKKSFWRKIFHIPAKE
jgi:hypothetical protein